MMKKSMLFIITLLVCYTLLFNGKVAIAGAINGIELCAEIVIPSTFAFMVIAGFISLSGLGKWIVFPFLPITRYLLHIPDDAACAVVMSFIGGYPTGAKTLATMVDYDILPRSTAARMFLYTTNVSPSFAVIAVGQIMLGKPMIGAVIFFAQILASLLIGIWVRPSYKTHTTDPAKVFSAPTAFVLAVNNASSAMITICGFIVFFSVVSQMISYYISVLAFPQFVAVIISGILEVTGGCTMASEIVSIQGILLIAFFCSFAGLSIIFQNISIATSSNIPTKGYLTYRLINGILSSVFTYLLIRFMPSPLLAMAISVPPTIVYSANQLIGAFCLIGMCMIITLTADKRVRFTNMNSSNKL